MKARVLLIDRIKPNPDAPGWFLLAGTCPICGGRHQHGGRPGDLGHRVSHCGGSDGYFLELAPGVEFPAWERQR